MLRRRMNTTFFILLIVGGAWLSFLIVEPFLSFIVGALLLTFVFYPLYRRVLPRVRYPGVASALVIVIIFLIVVIPVFFAVWSLAADVAKIARDLDADDFTAYIEQIDHRIATLTGFEILAPSNETVPSDTGADAGGGTGTADTNGTGPPHNDTGPPDDTTADATAGNGNGTGDTGDIEHPPAVTNRTRGLLKPGDVTRFIVPQVEALLTNIVRESIGFIFQAFLGVFVMFFIMYYGFKDGEKFVDFVRRTLPLRDEYKSGLFEQVRDVVDAVFIGQILVSLVQGALGGIGFWIFGVPNPFFWGFVMTLLAILPIIGTPVAFVPAALWLILKGNTFEGVGLLAYGMAIVSTVDNVLKPKVIGDRAEIHPAVVLLGVVGGIAYFGFIGFLLGPLIIGIFAVLLEMFSKDFVAREEAHLPALALQYQKTIPPVNVVEGTEVGAHGPHGFGIDPHTSIAAPRSTRPRPPTREGDGAADPDRDDRPPTGPDDDHDASS